MADRKEQLKELKRSHTALADALNDVIAAHLALKTQTQKKKAKPEAEEQEPWVCSGNVLTGDACAGGQGSEVRAADTRHEQKVHPTCKVCKRAINKTRAASRAKPEEAEAPLVVEAEEADE
jgi:hypothetical protein